MRRLLGKIAAANGRRVGEELAKGGGDERHVIGKDPPVSRG